MTFTGPILARSEQVPEPQAEHHVSAMTGAVKE
jgi:hypothetical protein